MIEKYDLKMHLVALLCRILKGSSAKANNFFEWVSAVITKKTCCREI